MAIGRGELVDTDAGYRLPVRLSMRPDLVLHRIREEQVLKAADLAALLEFVGRGREPSLPDSLLADSLLLAQHAEPIDLPRALLVAAIACELKIKTILRECASEAAA